MVEDVLGVSCLSWQFSGGNYPDESCPTDVVLWELSG